MSKAKAQKLTPEQVVYLDQLGEPPAPLPVTEPDYYDVVYLKRGDSGMYSPFSVPFPTKEGAEAHADQLRLGAQGAVKVMPRFWT